MYTQESLDRLRQKINIVEVISEHIVLKKRGATYKASCPFHSENTPSFIVNASQGHYHCFGCGVHGDAVSFLMNYLNYSFSEAVSCLSKKFEVFLETENFGEKSDGSKALLRSIYNEANTVFKYCFFKLPKAEEALQYLYNRGFTVDTFHRFGIGYAPNKNLFIKMMKERNVAFNDLKEAGFFVGEKCSFLFEDRITFPVFDIMNRTIGFSTRKYKESTYGGKYVNTPETPLFKKSSVLYGLNFSRRRMSKEKRALIVEGQIDCLQLIEAGLNLTVSALGTAFGEMHVKELEKLGIKKVFLLFDGDEPGKKAAIKIGDLFQICGMDVYVCSLPEKQDPDIFLRKNSMESLLLLLDKAQDYLSFLIFSIAAEKNLRSPIEKADLVDSLSKQIHSWKNPVVVHESLKKLASIMQLPEDVVTKFGLPPQRSTFLQVPQTRNKKMNVDPNKILETDVLRWLIRFGQSNPAFIATVENYLTEESFLIPDCQSLFRYCLSAYRNHDFSSPFKINEVVKDITLIDIIFGRKIRIEKAEEGFLESLQRLLERTWLSDKQIIQARINNSTEAGVWELLAEFDSIQKARPNVRLISSVEETK
ncbi:MAG: DNA primase [Victivallaceae bacterium]